ncbi:hypothetical protein Vadar_017123 [Vaccinium darrowii]|uniref:Uncharacterized protein n=1 Tax=Vaccinium darrowii TaxID=229202 RepID=A0ACB7X1B0_9ERIC|nr:hypothetical protein Vadar_017123 [Vaccinium darrowii]
MVFVLEFHKAFHLSTVYGFNQSSERRSLWSDMKSLRAGIGGRAWMQLGDFNVVRKPSERLEGFDSTAAAEFNSCIDFLNMDDMPTKGFWYTRSNKRGGDGDNKSRLDRAVVNAGWMDDYLDSEVCVEAPANLRRSYLPLGRPLQEDVACKGSAKS